MTGAASTHARVSQRGSAWTPQPTRLATGRGRLLQRCPGEPDCGCPHPEMHRDHVRGPSLQRSPDRGARRPDTGAAHAGIPPVVRDELARPGRPLPSQPRAEFGTRLGFDFSRVRIHDDDRAGASARAVGARAYTVGEDIVFAPGQHDGSREGTRLLAHELTHVVQQSGGGAGVAAQSKPETIMPAGDPFEREADRLADHLVAGAPAAPVGVAPAGALQRQVGQPAAPAQQPVCAQAVPARDEAIRWLGEARRKLRAYEAEEVFRASGARNPQQATQRALLSTFHTGDAMYASVIGSRLAHMQFALESGQVAIDCAQQGDLHCTGGTAAYAVSDRPYAMVICFPGTKRDHIASVIHELAHTALPQVGIRRSRTDLSNVRDRAYSSDRMIRLLTPDEALDNAETYALLVRMLVTGEGAASLITAPTDQPAGCPDDGAVQIAIARAERQVQDAVDTLEEYRAGRNALPDPILTRAGITDRAGVGQALAVYRAIQQIFNSAVPVTCSPRDASCQGGALGHARAGTVFSDRADFTENKRDGLPTLFLCGDWFGEGEAGRITSIHALTLLSHPPHLAGTPYRTKDTMRYVDLAAAISARRTPPPAARSAAEHHFRDVEQVADPNTPRPRPRP